MGCTALGFRVVVSSAVGGRTRRVASSAAAGEFPPPNVGT